MLDSSADGTRLRTKAPGVDPSARGRAQGQGARGRELEGVNHDQQEGTRSNMQLGREAPQARFRAMRRVLSSRSSRGPRDIRTGSTSGQWRAGCEGGGRGEGCRTPQQPGDRVKARRTRFGRPGLRREFPGDPRGCAFATRLGDRYELLHRHSPVVGRASASTAATLPTGSTPQTDEAHGQGQTCATTGTSTRER